MICALNEPLMPFVYSLAYSTLKQIIDFYNYPPVCNALLRDCGDLLQRFFIKVMTDMNSQREHFEESYHDNIYPFGTYDLDSDLFEMMAMWMGYQLDKQWPKDVVCEFIITLHAYFGLPVLSNRQRALTPPPSADDADRRLWIIAQFLLFDELVAKGPESSETKGVFEHFERVRDAFHRRCRGDDCMSLEARLACSKCHWARCTSCSSSLS